MASNDAYALFHEERGAEIILPPTAGIPEALVPFATERKLVEPILRRRDYLLDSWTSMNVARAARPFFMPESGEAQEQSSCPFCVGREDETPRDKSTGGDTIRFAREGSDWDLRVFPNLYPWLLHHVDIVEASEHKTRVFELTGEETTAALFAIRELCKHYHDEGLVPVVFKNHGFGTSIQHVHWQAGALPRVPHRVFCERQSAGGFRARHGKNAFDAIVDAEREERVRFIGEFGDGTLAAFAPFAPRTNFEIWLVFQRPIATVAECDDETLTLVGNALTDICHAIDRCAGLASFGLLCHQTEPGDMDYRLHFELIPYKHYGGAERGFEEFVVEVAPETVADRLRRELRP